MVGKKTTSIKISDESLSQYYVSLYFEALKRINRVNDIKVSFLKLSLASTFAYFSWLIVYQDKISSLPETWKLVLWFTPLIFNGFGFFYNLYLKNTASRYGDFTRYLISRIDNMRHMYDEFLVEKSPIRHHLSQVFWLIICGISLVFGIAGAAMSS